MPSHNGLRDAGGLDAGSPGGTPEATTATRSWEAGDRKVARPSALILAGLARTQGMGTINLHLPAELPRPVRLRYLYNMLFRAIEDNCFQVRHVCYDNVFQAYIYTTPEQRAFVHRVAAHHGMTLAELFREAYVALYPEHPVSWHPWKAPLEMVADRIKALSKAIPSHERQDFQQALWVRCLEARILDRVPPDATRVAVESFLNTCVVRLALNLRRGMDRAQACQDNLCREADLIQGDPGDPETWLLASQHVAKKLKEPNTLHWSSEDLRPYLRKTLTRD